MSIVNGNHFIISLRNARYRFMKNDNLISETTFSSWTFYPQTGDVTSVLINLLTNSKKQSCWKPNKPSTCQDFCEILRYMNRPLDQVIIQLNAVHSLISIYRTLILILSFNFCLRQSSLPFRLSEYILYERLTSLTHSTLLICVQDKHNDFIFKGIYILRNTCYFHIWMT